jgi:phosphoribosylformylglycinamidine cyclo-ligase
MVHNTGGGFIDNIPRILPKGYKAVLNTTTWPVPPIFPYLQKLGDIPEDEMYRTFNMGIGLLVIVDEAKATDIRHHFEAVGEEAYIIGEIAPMAAGETMTVEIRR